MWCERERQVSKMMTVLLARASRRTHWVFPSKIRSSCGAVGQKIDICQSPKTMKALHALIRKQALNE